LAADVPFPFCDPCKDAGEGQDPVAFCLVCRKLHCKKCLDSHGKFEANKSHCYAALKGDEIGSTCPCEVCEDNNKVAMVFCAECRKVYCTDCSSYHDKFNEDKNHLVFKLLCEDSKSEITELSEESATCSLDCDVIYSGAQVPLAGNKKQKQQEDTKESGASVPVDNQSTKGSKP